MARDATYPKGKRDRSVVMVTYPEAHILDVVGPLEVLTGAKYFLPAGPEPYRITVAASQAGTVPTTSGLVLTAHQTFDDILRDESPIDTLIVSGGIGATEAIKDKGLLDFVRQGATRSRRVVSICTGAMILAELGLPDGRRASPRCSADR